ncbi:MAG: hypothetical protein LBK99_02375 [Opitutaceae bacterium]|jgi:antitoxin component of RelBE/YafQ-DinJ toxin-antitoxin module|nr:hypothetical protein [Opitutaceae bacterium]
MKMLQVRIPDRLRDDADSVLADIGLDLPTAVRLYLIKIRFLSANSKNISRFS